MRVRVCVPASLVQLHMNNMTSDEDDCIAIGAICHFHRCVKQAFKRVKRCTYSREA